MSVIEELTRPSAAVVVEARQEAQLPAHVITEDQSLVTGLGKLRWHWTLDESNPDRVSFAEYARATGRKVQSIHESARRHEATLSGHPDRTAPIDNRGGARATSARPPLPSRARPRNTLSDYLDGAAMDLQVLEDQVGQWRLDPTHFTDGERREFHRATLTLRDRLDAMAGLLSCIDPPPWSEADMYSTELLDEPT